MSGKSQNIAGIINTLVDCNIGFCGKCPEKLAKMTWVQNMHVSGVQHC